MLQSIKREIPKQTYMEFENRIADRSTILQASSWKWCHDSHALVLIEIFCEFYEELQKESIEISLYFFCRENRQKTLVILLQTWKCKEFGYISIVVQKEVSNRLNENKTSTNEDWQDQSDKHRNNLDEITTQHLKDSGFGWLLKDLTVPQVCTPFRNTKNLLQKILLAM